MSLRLITLGGLRGTQDGVEVDWLRSQSLRAALLTYLAIERTSTRDALQLLLWPEAEGQSAGHRLNQNVFELRRALGHSAIATRGRDVSAGEMLTADAIDFEAALNQGRYADAVRLYGGPFLAGVHLVDTNEFESWVDAKRARHARMFRKACRALVEASFNSGDQAGALTAAEAWVEGDPADDEARHRLIELHAFAGNRSEALNQYEIYARMLERDRLTPLEETRALVATLTSPKGDVSTRHALAGSLTPLGPIPPEPATLVNLEPPDPDRPTRLGADVDPRLEPDVLPNLEVLRQIGAGAAARVYLARDVALQRLVALKVLHPELANDRTARARFEREARAAARLNHPNIVTVHQVGQLQDGTPYLVTEFVEGRNLADTLEAEGVLSEAETCSVLRQIAAALDAAHSRGFIHRDVRPANIVWTRESGRAVLMDFGIVAAVESGTQVAARLTGKGEVLGDPKFTSPEQLRSSNVTVASDIYSLGVVGYVMLAGNGPFPAAKGVRAIHAQIDQDPAPLTALRPETDRDLSDLLFRCLNKRPELRPTAREVGRALERIGGSSRPDRESTVQGNGKEPSPLERSILGHFVYDLRRRGVLKIASVYAAFSLVVLQVGDLILPALRVSSLYNLVVAIVLGGFPVALILGWMFDVSRSGIQRTKASAVGSHAGYRALGFVGLAVSVLLAVLIGRWIVSG